MPKTSKKKVAKKKSTRKKSTVPSVKRVIVKLRPNEIAQLVVPPEHRPVVVTETPRAIEIVPVPKARKKDWFEYLFGY